MVAVKPQEPHRFSATGAGRAVHGPVPRLVRVLPGEEQARSRRQQRPPLTTAAVAVGIGVVTPTAAVGSRRGRGVGERERPRECIEDLES